MAVEVSAGFLAFVAVFLINVVRFSWQQGVFLLPLARRFSRAEEPHKFHAALGLSALGAAACVLTLADFVAKLHVL